TRRGRSAREFAEEISRARGPCHSGGQKLYWLVFTSDNLRYRLTDPIHMSSDARHKSKRNTEFWRACRYLYPYRGMVVISIVCAIFVSAALAGGLGTLVPITRVFLNGDTVQTWAEREIAQDRI